MAYKLGSTEYKRQFYIRQRERGLCLECNAKPEAGKSRCRACLDRRKNLNHQHKQSAVASGKCTTCFKTDTLFDSRLCATCYLKDTSRRHLGSANYWQDLQALIESQDFKCALSGLVITLGKDAEVDHITPSARGGKSEIGNLQWTHVSVNRMKRDLLETEFYSLVESIYHQMKSRNRIR